MNDLELALTKVDPAELGRRIIAAASSEDFIVGTDPLGVIFTMCGVVSGYAPIVTDADIRAARGAV